MPPLLSHHDNRFAFHSNPAAGRKLADIEHSPQFEPWRDPQSGIVSYLLARRVAPQQQGFYYVNPCFTPDGRYCWFYVAHPPAGNGGYGRSLAVVDFRAGEVRSYPETLFLAASPAVDPATGEVYWSTGTEVWRRGPGAEDAPIRVNGLPADITKLRQPVTLGCHLSFSADRRFLGIDSIIGNTTYVGALPLDGGPFELWQTFDKAYNHLQCHPTDPDLMFICQEWWIDQARGGWGVEPKEKMIDNRMWTIRKGQKATPIYPHCTLHEHTHEWWSADGDWLWFVRHNTDSNVSRFNIRTGQDEIVWRWPGRLNWHAHCDRAGRYVVGDAQVVDWCSAVGFFNRDTQQTVNVVSAMRYIPALAKYHQDPHPQFCLNDQYIAYTSWVHGRMDVAFVPVDQLIAATSGRG